MPNRDFARTQIGKCLWFWCPHRTCVKKIDGRQNFHLEEPLTKLPDSQPFEEKSPLLDESFSSWLFWSKKGLLIDVGKLPVIQSSIDDEIWPKVTGWGWPTLQLSVQKKVSQIWPFVHNPFKLFLLKYTLMLHCTEASVAPPFCVYSKAEKELQQKMMNPTEKKNNIHNCISSATVVENFPSELIAMFPQWW